MRRAVRHPDHQVQKSIGLLFGVDGGIAHRDAQSNTSLRVANSRIEFDQYDGTPINVIAFP